MVVVADLQGAVLSLFTSAPSWTPTGASSSGTS